MRDTRELLLTTDFPAIRKGVITTLQVNLGYKCNLSCSHCHVNAGPTRTEMMNADVVALLKDVVLKRAPRTLDLTGGAPELSPHFRELVIWARSHGLQVIDRCNLTILQEPDQIDLAEFLAQHQVKIVASLPCYSEQNVRQQRGQGVFEASIAGLQQLNRVGYGIDPELELDLVYNPNGAFLPPPQKLLEADYKRELQQHWGVQFNHLLTLTNMPIQRFGATLLAQGNYHDYMHLLRQSYEQVNLDSVMCRTLWSIDWQGYLFDCDFNQMLQLPARLNGDLIGRDRPHLRDLLLSDSTDSDIAIGEHCYGCTAGQGSSCGGALGS